MYIVRTPFRKIIYIILKEWEFKMCHLFLDIKEVTPYLNFLKAKRIKLKNMLKHSTILQLV